MATISEVEIFFKVFSMLLIAINIFGNVLVVLSVRRFPHMKTPMNRLLVHLAVCDILQGILFFPRIVLRGLYHHPIGKTGDILCRLLTHGNIGWVFSCASVYILVVIAIERYNAIMKPHGPRLSPRKIKFALFLCWAMAIVICFLGQLVIGFDQEKNSCDYHWKNWSKNLEKLDAVLWLVGSCAVPLITLCVLYARIVHKVWFATSTTDIAQRSLVKSRKKITQSALTVTVVVMLCWLPILLYYNVTMVLHGKVVGPLFDSLSHSLLLLNSTLNPFIYAAYDVRFRRCMRETLCKGELNRGQGHAHAREINQPVQSHIQCTCHGQRMQT